MAEKGREAANRVKEGIHKATHRVEEGAEKATDRMKEKLGR